MNIVEKREFIYSHLHQIDECYIDEIFDKISHVVGDADVIVGYKPDGAPITKAELMARAKQAEDDIVAGRTISQEDLEKEIENW